MEWELGISRCKLVSIEWINNKVLLYSAGNYIQYPVINKNGKEYEKEYIYICKKKWKQTIKKSPMRSLKKKKETCIVLFKKPCVNNS